MGSLSAGLDNMLGLPLLLALSILGTEAQNINCGQRTRRVISVDVNQTFSFTSQRKGLAQYLSDTDCRALYKQGPNCRTIQFSCSQLAVKAGWKKPSKITSDRHCWGDFMKVRRYGQNQRFCRNQKFEPEFNSTGPISVFFHAKEDHKVSTGAVCKIACTEDYSKYKGVFESENYPLPYNSSYTLYSNGRTHVTVPAGFVIKFTIQAFDVPEEFYLEYKDTTGSTMDHCQSANGMAGFSVPKCAVGDTYTTTSNTGGPNWEGYQGHPTPNTATGFRIIWQAIPDPTLRSLDLDYDYLDYDLEALEEEYSQ